MIETREAEAIARHRATKPPLAERPTPGSGLRKDQSRLFGAKETYISLLAAGGILLHLIFHYGLHIGTSVSMPPLYAVLVLGGVPLVVDLVRKAIRLQFGSDLLAGASAPLYTWKWKSTYDGTRGGVSSYLYNDPFPGDPGSGTGGVTITSINDFSVVPTPSSGTACNGLYDGTFKGSITVSTGQTCAFVDPFFLTNQNRGDFGFGFHICGMVQPSALGQLDDVSNTVC